MNKNKAIPLLISILNWTITIACMLGMTLPDYSSTPKSVYKMMLFYAGFSIIPSIASLVLAKMLTEKSWQRTLSYILNIIFISIYLVIFIAFSILEP